MNDINSVHGNKGFVMIEIASHIIENNGDINFQNQAEYQTKLNDFEKKNILHT